MNSLAERLRFAREQKGLGQEELAKLVGVTQQTVQQIEAGLIKRPRRIREIAAAVERSPAWLQFGVEEIDSLDKDAINLAQAWMHLKDPEKTALFNAITEMAKSSKKKR
jgi:transcriptional regulator with XRE-family HTH domain